MGYKVSLTMFLFLSTLFSQNLIVHLSDGTIKHYPISDIQKITFEVQTVSIAEKPLQGNTGNLTAVSSNPLASLFNIRYSVSKNVLVSIQIFTPDGKLVRTVARLYRMPGNYSETWDCSGDNGVKLGRGNYIVAMKIGEKTIAKSIVNIF